MFEIYEKYLDNIKKHGDYWYDVALFEASAILNSFEKNDWELLAASILKKSQIWIISCLETLELSESIEAEGVVFNVINNVDDFQILYCAINTLNEFIFDNVNRAEIPEIVKRKLFCMKLNNGVNFKLAVELLEKKRSVIFLG
jgi:hypothetical protein